MGLQQLLGGSLLCQGVTFLVDKDDQGRVPVVRKLPLANAAEERGAIILTSACFAWRHHSHRIHIIETPLGTRQPPAICHCVSFLKAAETVASHIRGCLRAAAAARSNGACGMPASNLRLGGGV